MWKAGEYRIGREDAYLGLSPSWAGLDARLVVPNLNAETIVHLTDPAKEDDIAAFFANLATDWRGWEGLRRWAAYEGGLALTCAHDGLGNVTVSVELSEYSGHQGWLARADVTADAGQLDAISAAVAELVRGHS